MHKCSKKDMSDPEAKESYDQVKENFEDFQRMVKTCNNVLEKLQKEEEDMKMPDAEDIDDSPAEDSAEENGEGPSSGPAVAFTDSTPGSSSSKGKNRLHPDDSTREPSNSKGKNKLRPDDSAQGADPSDPIVTEEDELDLVKVHKQLPTSGLPDAKKYRKIVVVKNAVSEQRYLPTGGRHRAGNPV